MKPNCKRCGGSGIEPDQKAIGRIMQQLRLDAGIGLRELAVHMRISHGFLSQLESGQRTWSHRLTRSFYQQLEKLTKQRKTPTP